MTKLKVAFFSATGGFCHYYRCKFPGDELVKQGLAEVRFIDPNAMQEVADAQEWADIIVFQYATPAKYFVKLADIITKFQEPKLMVVDFDDNFFDVDPLNNSYKNLGIREVTDKGVVLWKEGEDGFNIKNNEEALKDIAIACSAADIITVTTQELAEVYNKFNKNVVILPNYIQPDVMPVVKEKKKNNDEIVIGWMGSDSHAKDLFDILPALKKIKKMYGKKVKFKFIGSFLARKIYEKVDGEFVPWIKPNLFYDMFSKQHFDIGLIACSDTLFNIAKSPIKWLEYSHYSICTIAPDMPPYSHHIKHGYTGYLYKGNDNLVILLNDLIKDNFQRVMLASNARRRVAEHYDIRKYVKDWITNYEYSLNKKIESYKTCK